MPLLTNAFVRFAYNEQGYFVASGTMPELRTIRHKDADKFVEDVGQFFFDNTSVKAVEFIPSDNIQPLSFLPNGVLTRQMLADKSYKAQSAPMPAAA